MGVAAQLTLLADEKVELGLDKFYEEIKRGDTYEAYEGLREALGTVLSAYLTEMAVADEMYGS